jgi:hypothetical protein
VSFQNLDLILDELHRARQEHLEHVDAQDEKLGVLFAVGGAFVALTTLLWWPFAHQSRCGDGWGNRQPRLRYR